MKDFLKFDVMITPKFITVIFYVFSVLAVLMGIIAVIGGLAMERGGGQAVLMGLFMLLLGPVFVRIWCEVIIVFFKMNDHLAAMAEDLAEMKGGAKAE